MCASHHVRCTNRKLQISYLTTWLTPLRSLSLFGELKSAVYGPGLGGILSFFFERRDDFTEVLEFVHAMNAQYELQVRKMHGDFKAGLEQLVSVSGVRAIFLGTRRSGSQKSSNECLHFFP